MDDETGNAVPQPPWARCTLEDIEGLDMQAVVAAATSADAGDLAGLYHSAAEGTSTGGQPTAATRACDLMQGILGMHLRANERHSPFGAMFKTVGGSRSAVPEDFRHCVDVLARLLETVEHPVVRARLADVAWLLERRRADCSSIALDSYMRIVRDIEQGNLVSPYADGVFGPMTRDCLRRALHIARATGWDKEDAVALRNLVAGLARRARSEAHPQDASGFYQVVLEYGVADAFDWLGPEVEGLAEVERPGNVHLRVDLFRIAAQAYAVARQAADQQRCLLRAAEILAAEAEATAGRSSILAADLLASAISQLSRVPGQRDLRNDWRRRLVEIQAHSHEELGSFSSELDLEAFIRKVDGATSGACLWHQVVVLATMMGSPDPATLDKEAEELAGKFPLAGVFAQSYLDRDGKIVHRERSGGFGKDGMNLDGQVARSRQLHRHVAAMGIDRARANIAAARCLTQADFRWLAEASPFVPPELTNTWSVGLTRFFQGDFVEALFILTMMIEPGLRYVLKNAGHDVATFDDATQTQQDRTISAIFDKMRPELEAVFGVGLVADLGNALLDELGPGIRHAVAHGLLHDGTPYSPDAVYCCWLALRLCVLPIANSSEPIEVPPDWER